MSWRVVSYSKEDFEYWLQANGHDVDLLSEEEMGIVAAGISIALGRMDILGEVMDVVMGQAVIDKYPEREVYALLDRLIPGECSSHTWVYPTQEEAEQGEAYLLQTLGGKICKR